MLGYDFTFLTQNLAIFGRFEWEIFKFWFEWENWEKWDFLKWDFRNLWLFFSLFSLIIFWTVSFMCENSKNCVMLHQFDNVRLFQWNILNSLSFTFGLLVSCQTIMQGNFFIAHKKGCEFSFGMLSKLTSWYRKPKMSKWCFFWKQPR